MPSDQGGRSRGRLSLRDPQAVPPESQPGGAEHGRFALAVDRRWDDHGGSGADTEGASMQAKIGDQIVIGGRRVGQPGRNCEGLEIRHPNGEPPYLVRWGDTGNEDLFFPGPDASPLLSTQRTDSSTDSLRAVGCWSTRRTAPAHRAGSMTAIDRV